MPTRKQVREWALVLDSEGVPYDITRGPGGWTLVVSPQHAEAAKEVLGAWHEENIEEEEVIPEPESGGVFVPLVFLGAMLLFFAFTGPRIEGSEWFPRGATRASELLSGEPWRAITALTLHADWGHVFSNVLFGALFFVAVTQMMGPGLGMGMILLAGGLGNVLNAWVQGPMHSSVGASTAVFGAVGLLAGLRLTRRRQHGARLGKAWLPVSAGLALLAMLGMGPDTDILAHIFGFVAGVPIGAIVGRLVRQAPGLGWQALLLAADVYVIVWAWRLAWGAIPSL